MPGTPKRLLIHRAVSDALLGITTGSGYDFDLGPENVVRGKLYFSSDTDPETVVAINELAPRETQPSVDGADQRVTLALSVQGFAPDSTHHTTDRAHVLLANIRECLWKACQVRSPGNPRQPQPFGLDFVERAEMSYGMVSAGDQEISDSAFCFVELTITYVESVNRLR